MINSISLEEKYSTTKFLTKEKPNILNDPENKFESVLFLPESNGRKGEGGLRTKGYFKNSYDNKPLISIITVVYNGEKYLEETIQSVISQTYDNIEYIIIDGGSTDQTINIVKKYEDKIDYWVSEKDNGIYDAWNKGIKLSTGKWISFLGSDDIYVKNALKIYVKNINSIHEKIDYISSSVELINKNEKLIRRIGTKWKWKTFKKYMNVAHVGSMHNRILFNNIGLYNTNYKIAADYELLLRKGSNLKSIYINYVTARMHDGGISNKMIYLALKETMNIKVQTGKRNKILVKLEYIIAYLKYFFRKIIC